MSKSIDDINKLISEIDHKTERIKSEIAQLENERALAAEALVELTNHHARLTTRHQKRILDSLLD